MLQLRTELRKGPEVMPQVAKLLTMVPVEHYENKVMARTAVKLHAMLKEADPDGTLLAAALEAQQPNEGQQARIDAFVQAGVEAEKAARSEPDADAEKAA